MSDDDLGELRRQTDPGTRAEGAGGSSGLQSAMVDELQAIERGDASKTLSLRDERLAALVRALDETGDIDDVGAALRDALGRDGEGDVDRSELLRLAVRLGLEDGAPETLAAARDAYAEHATEQF